MGNFFLNNFLKGVLYHKWIEQIPWMQKNNNFWFYLGIFISHGHALSNNNNIRAECAGFIPTDLIN